MLSAVLDMPWIYLRCHNGISVLTIILSLGEKSKGKAQRSALTYRSVSRILYREKKGLDADNFKESLQKLLRKIGTDQAGIQGMLQVASYELFCPYISTFAAVCLCASSIAA